METELAAAVHTQPDDLAALSRASSALWLATLSLMTAYMRNTAPAHRYLVAWRIARNLSTLREQECFGASTRDSFARLAVRWRHQADALSPTGPRRRGFLERLLQRLRSVIADLIRNRRPPVSSAAQDPGSRPG